MLEALGLCLRFNLRIYELELVASSQNERRVRFRTHTNPIDSRRRWLRPVGLDRNLESLVVERAHEVGVELKQGLSTRADHVGPRLVRRIAWPQLGDASREIDRRSEFAAVFANTEEIRIAELADGVGAILLQPCPQVAAAEATKNGGAPGVVSLALERVEDLFNCVHGIEWDL